MKALKLELCSPQCHWEACLGGRYIWKVYPVIQFKQQLMNVGWDGAQLPLMIQCGLSWAQFVPSLPQCGADFSVTSPMGDLERLKAGKLLSRCREGKNWEQPRRSSGVKIDDDQNLSGNTTTK